MNLDEPTANEIVEPAPPYVPKPKIMEPREPSPPYEAPDDLKQN